MSSRKAEKSIYLLTDNNWDFPEMEVRMKMQTEGIYIIKAQQSPDEDWYK